MSHLTTIMDGLELIAALMIGSTLAICSTLIWLQAMVARQFRQHDSDLRAVVEGVSAKVDELVAKQ